MPLYLVFLTAFNFKCRFSDYAIFDKKIFLGTESFYIKPGISWLMALMYTGLSV